MHIATKGSKIDISSEKKLEEFASSISNDIKKTDIIFLFGEMGVGKTTFVKYLINHLQNKFKKRLTEVTSPTFNIMNEYKIDTLLIKHYDLYRINSPEELMDLNIFDKNDDSVLLIEWPQIIKQKPKSIIEFYFEYENHYEDRFIKIKFDEV